MKWRVTIAACVVFLRGAGVPAQSPSSQYPFIPAVYDGMDQRMVLFPLAGKQEATVSLTVGLGGYALSPDGKTLYSTAGEIHDLKSLMKVTPGLFRIDLRSMRLSSVAGSGDFRFFSSMSTSLHQEETVVAGKYWDGSRVVCGVFSLDHRSGVVRPVLSTEDCSDTLARTDISLSPDLKYAVAIHEHSVELIDMRSGRVRKLGEGFMKAAWSPDGKWIAAAKYSLQQANMVLFDGATFATAKTLASSVVLRVLWSPDSRFLLARKLVSGCGPDEYTFEAFEVQTRRELLIPSSSCKVRWNYNEVGWVDEAVGTNR